MQSRHDLAAVILGGVHILPTESNRNGYWSMDEVLHGTEMPSSIDAQTASFGVLDRSSAGTFDQH
jgi:hypothetical protein